MSYRSFLKYQAMKVRQSLDLARIEAFMKLTPVPGLIINHNLVIGNDPHTRFTDEAQLREHMKLKYPVNESPRSKPRSIIDIPCLKGIPERVNILLHFLWDASNSWSISSVLSTAIVFHSEFVRLYPFENSETVSRFIVAEYLRPELGFTYYMPKIPKSPDAVPLPLAWAVTREIETGLLEFYGAVSFE
jgi:hypothetical protein